MTLYLTAFRGRFGRESVPGHFWNPEAGESLRALQDHLRREDPWLSPLVTGRQLFTLGIPADPEGTHLKDGEAGELTLKGHERELPRLLRTLFLEALRAEGARVDLADGFVLVESAAVQGSVLGLDGVRVRLEVTGEQEFVLWLEPCRRLVDSRPLPEALKERHGRPIDIWFPLEGVSHPGVNHKATAAGVSVSLARHARLVRPSDAATLLLGDEAVGLDPRRIIEGMRSLLGRASFVERGFKVENDPLLASELGYSESRDLAPRAHALSVHGEFIALGEHFHAALGGHTALADESREGVFHLVGDYSAEDLEGLAKTLTRKAGQWKAARLRFVREPEEGSQAIAVCEGAQRHRLGAVLHIDPRSPLAQQPDSPRAQGQMASLFLECCKVAGGTPWRLEGEDVVPTLGLVTGFQHGRQPALGLALTDGSGNLVDGWVAPLRAHEGPDAALARSLRERLGLASDLTVMVSEDGQATEGFLRELVPQGAGVRVRRARLPGLVAARTYDWAEPGEIAVSERRALACIDRWEGGVLWMGVERIWGQVDPLRALRQAMVLQSAWIPGRVEPHWFPAPVEWARLFLQHRERAEAFLPVGAKGHGR